MTCIVGLEHGGAVYMGGDSAAVSGYDVTLDSIPKVFLNGDMIFGFTSSFRMGQLLRYKLVPPPRKRSRDVMHYLVNDFVDAVRACFNESGYMKKINTIEDQGGNFLLGYAGRLYQVHTDFTVIRGNRGFDAVGCATTAHGAMAATVKMRDPVKRIRLALQVAETTNIGVRRPFTILKGGVL